MQIKCKLYTVTNTKIKYYVISNKSLNKEKKNSKDKTKDSPKKLNKCLQKIRDQKNKLKF